MPAKRKTREDRMQDAFTALYRVGKSRSGMTEAEVADALGITRPTLQKRRQNPGSFPFGDVLKLSILFCWDGEELMQIVGFYAKGGN